MNFYSRLSVDIDEFILEVEKRPGIYDQLHEDYNDKKKKNQLWEEVYSIIVPDWEELSMSEKNEKGKEIHRRWRSLKDCFRRELHIQKNGDKNDFKRKRYRYFEQLLFLLPTMESRKTSVSLREDSVENSDSCDNETPADLPVRSIEMPLRPIAMPVKPAAARTAKKRKVAEDLSGETEFEEELLGMVDSLRRIRDEESDEDRLFLLSLVQTLKRVPQDSKMCVKIELMQVLQRATALAHHSGFRRGGTNI